MFPVKFFLFLFLFTPQRKEESGGKEQAKPSYLYPFFSSASLAMLGKNEKE